MLLSALAAPTDPTATLAVAHEYNAKDDVMSSVMGVAAFDDAIGIVLYSIAVAFAGSFIAPEGLILWAGELAYCPPNIWGLADRWCTGLNF